MAPEVSFSIKLIKFAIWKAHIWILFCSVTLQLLSEWSDSGLRFRKRWRAIYTSERENVYIHENSQRTRKVYVIWILSLSGLLPLCLYLLTHPIYDGLVQTDLQVDPETTFIITKVIIYCCSKLGEKCVKVCFHSSYSMQESLHFEEFFGTYSFLQYATFSLEEQWAFCQCYFCRCIDFTKTASLLSLKSRRTFLRPWRENRWRLLSSLNVFIKWLDSSMDALCI